MAVSLSQKPVVAILEDHDDTREMLEVGLQPEFSTRVFRDATELLSSLEDGNFSAVIADIMMPQMDGFRFIETAAAILVSKSSA